jgi:hypothetical protein
VIPSTKPTSQPSLQPTFSPSSHPSGFPTNQPSMIPSSRPSSFPSTQPTSQPTEQPTEQPLAVPSSQPSDQPSAFPSDQPSTTPTADPTQQPFSFPSSAPSCQPTSFPSKQPISLPSPRPSSQPTMIPSLQPFSAPTGAPLVTITQTKGVINYLGNEAYSSDNSEVLGTSYILFGKNYKYKNKFPYEISLQSPHSPGFVSRLQEIQGGIRNDGITRSTTVIGDINGDKFVDLLVGYPMESKCMIFSGIGNGLVAADPSLAIIGDISRDGGQLGWASFPIGDVNHDGTDDMLISAVFANMLYLIYGRKNFPETVLLHELSTKEVCKIIGSSSDRYFGIALALVHDFNNDGSKEIAISAMRSSDGRGIVYLLFGSVGLANGGEIDLDQLLASNSRHLLKIIGPVKTYAGFSIAGIGDINRDDYDDLAIGSVPHASGEQMTYIIYGKKELNPNNELHLSSFTAEDGFIVKGAGFLVQAAGDVNYDGIPDVMITQFSEWSSHGQSYLLNFPENVTYSPTFQPSSMPSITQTTCSPSSLPSTKPSLQLAAAPFLIRPTSLNSFSPSIVETALPSTAIPSPIPTLTPSTAPTSERPSLIPTERPTILRNIKTFPPIHHSSLITPTRSPTNYRGLRTNRPSFNPTIQSTINTTTFTTIYCPLHGRYEGNKETNNKFIITAMNGTVEVKGNEEADNINIYSLRCSGSILDVVITSFRSSTDSVDLSELSAFYSYRSLEDIAYSFHKDSLILFFCHDSLLVTLSDHTEFDLQESNFIFDASNNEKKHETKSESNYYAAEIQLGIFVGFIFFVVTGYVLLDGFYGFGKKVEDDKKLQEDNETDVHCQEEQISDMNNDTGFRCSISALELVKQQQSVINNSSSSSSSFSHSSSRSSRYHSNLETPNPVVLRHNSNLPNDAVSHSDSWKSIMRSDSEERIANVIDKEESREEEELSSIPSDFFDDDDDAANVPDGINLNNSKNNNHTTFSSSSSASSDIATDNGGSSGFDVEVLLVSYEQNNQTNPLVVEQKEEIIMTLESSIFNGKTNIHPEKQYEEEDNDDRDSLDEDLQEMLRQVNCLQHSNNVDRKKSKRILTDKDVGLSRRNEVNDKDATETIVSNYCDIETGLLSRNLSF